MFISHMCCEPSWLFLCEKKPTFSCGACECAVLLLNSQIVSPSQISRVLSMRFGLFFPFVFWVFFLWGIMRFLIISTNPRISPPEKKKKACSSQSSDVHLSVCKEAHRGCKEAHRGRSTNACCFLFSLLVRSNPFVSQPSPDPPLKL
jgi:hypothetical protein